MKKQVLKVAVAAAMLVGAQAASANSVVDFGFESGLGAWNTLGSVSTQTGPYSHPEGQYYAQLSGPSSLVKSVSILGGQTIEFAYRFIAGDYMPFNDSSWFFNVDGTSYSLGSVSSVGNYGDSGWKTFSWTAPLTYNGPLMFSVFNVSDNSLNSTLLIDAVGAVPVPAAGLLFGSALLGAVGFGRRKDKKSAVVAA